jgi:hypothetical protein
MKNFKKALAMVVAVATLGTVSSIVTSAEVTYVNDYDEEGTFYDTYEEYLDELGLELMAGETQEAWDYNACLYFDWFIYHNPRHSVTGNGDISEIDYGPLEEYINSKNLENTTIGDSTATDDDATIGDSDSTEPSETTLQRGDVNGDGKINAVDLLQLKKYILGLIDTLD